MSKRDLQQAAQLAAYERGCAGKEAHVSRNAAEFVAGQSRVALVAYECSFCSSWHLGSAVKHRSDERAPIPKPPAFERLRHHLKRPKPRGRARSRHRWGDR